MFEGRKYDDETAAWRRFWSNRARGSEHRYREPAAAAVIGDHWQAYFGKMFAGRGVVGLIDLACGEGEVLQYANAQALQMPDMAMTAICADIAPDAVRLAGAAGGAEPAVADCARLPFCDGAFTDAVSQYGLEYAGPRAFSEAARIIGAGGQFHALVHCEHGAVAATCSDVAKLLESVLDAALFERLSTCCQALSPGDGRAVDTVTLEPSVEALRQALQRVTEAVTAAPDGPARVHVARLVGDCQRLVSRVTAYAPADVEAWIAGQRAEIDAFHHRMTSMLRVAQSDADMRELAAALAGQGLVLAPVAELAAPDGEAPLAWILHASRPA